MVSKTKDVSKNLEVPKEIARDDLGLLHTGDDPNVVRRNALEKLREDHGSYMSKGDDVVFKAMTLGEFENGTLLTVAVPELYRTFAIDLMRRFHEEYKCQTPSEKATAELAAENYVRVLDLQRRMTNYLSKDSVTDLGLRFLDILSKEMDRAQRHYLTTIQTLKSLRQPPMQLNIKASTAVVGQNQIVQSNNDKPK